jgi:hypothetical protein
MTWPTSECGKYGKNGKFSASFFGRKANLEHDCYGNSPVSEPVPIKTFRTFRTFRSPANSRPMATIGFGQRTVQNRISLFGD